MNFCWFTSFIGYPSFFQSEGRGADLARAFMTLGDAAEAGTPYVEAKALFPELDSAQVETKKAAFQEFGLLYVVPRSNTLTLTGLGHQVRVLCTDRKHIEGNRRQILLSLGRALARYQFDNPIPVGGNRKEMRKRAASSDVLPYLACFYLLHKLGGVLAVGEAESEALKELPHREYKEGRQRLVERQGLELPPTPEAVMLNSGVGAELTVARDVEKHGWAVTYRGSLRGYGYDLEAKRADTTLRIEVKSSVDYCVPTLTQEEWRAAQEHADDFVLAVVDFFGSERQRIYYVRNPAANLRPAERNVLIYPLRRAEVLRIATDEIS